MGAVVQLTLPVVSRVCVTCPDHDAGPEERGAKNHDQDDVHGESAMN